MTNVEMKCSIVFVVLGLFAGAKGEETLCDIYSVSLDDVTKEICDNESDDVCEAYIKKGTVNGVDVESCTDYCGAYGLACSEMWDDSNGCTRKTQYASCDNTTSITGGDTSDHICVCTEKLCDKYGVSVDDVTKTICENELNVCEAYIKKDTIIDVNGEEVYVESCTQYCEAYGLTCSEMWDDSNGCTTKTQYPSCDETGSITGGETSDHICVCGPPSA